MLKKWNRVFAMILVLATVFSLLVPIHAAAAAMKQGSSGAEVRYLQQNLIGLGFLNDKADGKYGSKTVTAVKEFQAAFGLAPDGCAGKATRMAVYNAIVRLQVELKNAGCAPGTADGHFGSKTKTALEKYQRNHGLKVTGVADNATRNCMDANSDGIRAGVAAQTREQVRQMQMALIGLGYLQGTADGVYGTKTREAVRLYQKAYGLGVDGTAGPDTMTSLKNAVTALQSDLAQWGFYLGKVDSSFGKGTESAVKAYQKYVGVSQTGVAGPKTMEKLYGYSLGQEVMMEVRYKTWIDPLYQDTDNSTFKYNNRTQTKYVKTSGCAGVATAMVLNALLDTHKYTGQNVMQWFADNGYYLGNGTYLSGVLKYPRVLGLNSTYCSKARDLADHLMKDRLAVALISDKTGEQLFTYRGSKGHYVVVSGYRVKDGKEQVFINNPLSYMASTWFDLEDLMANANNRSDQQAFVIMYK